MKFCILLMLLISFCLKAETNNPFEGEAYDRQNSENMLDRASNLFNKKHQVVEWLRDESRVVVYHLVDAEASIDFKNINDYLGQAVVVEEGSFVARGKYALCEMLLHRADPAFCFYPSHAIKLESKERVLWFVICWGCHNYVVLSEDFSMGDSFGDVPSLKAFFEEVMPAYQKQGLESLPVRE